MELKRLFYYSIEVLSWLVLIALWVDLGYFVKDIWKDFQAGKTNDRVYSTSINYFSHPTISICFEPRIKETLLKKRYNKTLDDLRIGNSMTDLTVPVQTLLNEVSYKPGRDFSLYLMLSGHESNHNFIHQFINNTTHVEKFKHVFQIEELPSTYYGTCTVIRISKKVKGSIKLVNIIKIIFKTEDENELPLANVFFTSEENFHGAALSQWTEGEVYALAIDPRQKLDYAVNLKRQISKRLMDTSFCHPDRSYYKCLAER